MLNMKQLRKAYHEEICKQVLGYRAKVPNIADKTSKRSIEVAQGILTRIRTSHGSFGSFSSTSWPACDPGRLWRVVSPCGAFSPS